MEMGKTREMVLCDLFAALMAVGAPLLISKVYEKWKCVWDGHLRDVVFSCPSHHQFNSLTHKKNIRHHLKVSDVSHSLRICTFIYFQISINQTQLTGFNSLSFSSLQ